MVWLSRESVSYAGWDFTNVCLLLSQVKTLRGQIDETRIKLRKVEQINILGNEQIYYQIVEEFPTKSLITAGSVTSQKGTTQIIRKFFFFLCWEIFSEKVTSKFSFVKYSVSEQRTVKKAFLLISRSNTIYWTFLQINKWSALSVCRSKCNKLMSFHFRQLVSIFLWRTGDKTAQETTFQIILRKNWKMSAPNGSTTLLWLDLWWLSLEKITKVREKSWTTKREKLIYSCGHLVLASRGQSVVTCVTYAYIISYWFRFKTFQHRWDAGGEFFWSLLGTCITATPKPL